MTLLFGVSGGKEQAGTAAVPVSVEGHAGQWRGFGLCDKEGAGAAAIPIGNRILEVVTGLGQAGGGSRSLLVGGGEQDGASAVSFKSGEGGSIGVVFGRCLWRRTSWRGDLLVIGEGGAGGAAGSSMFEQRRSSPSAVEKHSTVTS